MPDYSKSKIYKITTPSHPELVYIGSTTESLKKRFSGHKSKYKTYKKGKCRYYSSFKIIECGDAEIILIKNVCCNNRKELEKIEGELIFNTICCNKFVAGRTSKQYYEANKEKNKEKNKARSKAYYEANKAKINARRRAKYKAKKEKEKYYEDKKAKYKKFREDNKEKILFIEKANYKI